VGPEKNKGHNFLKLSKPTTLTVKSHGELHKLVGSQNDSNLIRMTERPNQYANTPFIWSTGVQCI